MFRQRCENCFRQAAIAREYHGMRVLPGSSLTPVLYTRVNYSSIKGVHMVQRSSLAFNIFQVRVTATLSFYFAFQRQRNALFFACHNLMVVKLYPSIPSPAHHNEAKFRQELAYRRHVFRSQLQTRTSAAKKTPFRAKKQEKRAGHCGD